MARRAKGNARGALNQKIDGWQYLQSPFHYVLMMVALWRQRITQGPLSLPP